MEDMRGESVSVRVQASLSGGKTAEFGVSGNTIVFPGYLRAYVAGINGWNRLNSVPAARFTTNDVIALSALFASRFGQNGGREVQNAMFLDALHPDADANCRMVEVMLEGMTKEGSER